MSHMNELQSFGSCIRHLLQQKGINAEQLVSLMNDTGLVQTNKPAMSRIMTGKRMPSVREIKVMGDIFETPLLYEAYQCLQKYEQKKDEVYLLTFHEKMDMLVDERESVIGEIPRIDYGMLFRMVKELQRYCLNQDVMHLIKEGFLEKLAQVKGFGEMIERLKLMYRCLVYAEGLDSKDQALLAAALLYFISPIDLIPDYLLPYGYIDDAIVVGFVFQKLSASIHQFMERNDKEDEPLGI